MPPGVPFRDDSTAYASNWRTIIAVDLTMGVIVVVAGLVVGLTMAWWGWLLAAAGAVQLFFAGGRASRWARLRGRAGL